MKKLARILSTILVITILVGIGWYFFPAQQVKDGAKNVKEYIAGVWSDLDKDNIHAEGIKLSGKDNSTYGDLGESLNFSNTTCIYRSLLTLQQQGVYNQIYANAKSSTESFKLIFALSVDELSETYVAVMCDHPEIFWLDNRYQYGYKQDDKSTAVQLTLKFNTLKDQLGTAKTKFDSAANTIINGASIYSDTLSKERYVFETISKNVEYNEDAPYNQTSYSALVGRSTVCAGYSRAFQYILNKLNIPCYYIYGTANGGYHAWNLVQIDGKWYNVDLTWSDQPTGITYTYFNIPDNIMSTNHTRSETSSKLPTAFSADKTVKPDGRDTTAEDSPELSIPQGSPGTQQPTKQQSILQSVSDYNSACYSYLTANGVGTYSFTVTLANETIYDEILQCASRKDYEAGYLNAAATVLGLSDYTYDYQISGDLNDETGLVLLTQTVTFTGT